MTLAVAKVIPVLGVRYTPDGPWKFLCLALICGCSCRGGNGRWNERSQHMDKPRWLLVQMTAKGLAFLLVLGLFLGKGSQAFARDEDPGLLNQQVFKLYQQGKYQEAIPLAEKLLAIRKQTLGPDHPDTATSLGYLARLYKFMGDYGRAEPLYQQALQIRKKVLGPEHPDTAESLDNLAELYVEIGAYVQAEPLFHQALQIEKKVLGPEDPATATTFNNLANLYGYRGDYAKAEPLYQQALQIRKKVLGPEHPDTAESLNNLAQLLRATNRLSEAEPLFERCVVIHLKSCLLTGHLHPNLRSVFENYLGFLTKMALSGDEISKRVWALGTEAGFDDEGYQRVLEQVNVRSRRPK